ncbi:unnamed protein product [Rhodiola kirilowii]
MCEDERCGATACSGKGKYLRSSEEFVDGGFKAGGGYHSRKILDRKRGQRKKRNTNGYVYDDCVRRKDNLQDEQGRYISLNGEEYDAEWKRELMSGRGTLIWNNGDKYDGIWENGAPKGSGVFTWTDGSYYIGDWCKDGLDQQQLDGVYYSGIGVPRGLGMGVSFHGEGLGKRLDGFSSIKEFPRICVWESDGEDGDITCEIVDNSDVSMSLMDGKLSGVGNELMYFSPTCFGDEAKKPGEIIRKGHKNYDLMLSLQLGVRCSVGKHDLVCQQLKSSDFDPNEKFWTKFPPEGSKITPPHRSAEFRWKDYCPMVFRHLRERFQVDPDEYIMSMCGNGGLRELSSPGKSGSLFYLTQDDRFMIKTVKKSEVKVLVKMLPSYYQHVCRYPNTLVTKFFGVHCVKPIYGQKTRFIVMGNLFCTEYPIHERYDLKGSSYGRKTDKPECEIDENTTRKDLDLNFVFFLGRYWFRELLKQIDLDCKFLEAVGIMDYSLLVGLHFRCNNSKNQLRSGKSELYQIEKFLSGFHFLEAEFDNLNRVNGCRKQSIRLGANMQARAERIIAGRTFDQRSPGGVNNFTQFSGESYDVILQFGIIDILQDYDISKKLEHAYKSFQADPSSISAVDPKLYSRRFRDFIAKIFAKEA